MGNNLDYVLRTAKERGVSFIRLWFVDVLGETKGIAFPISELERMIDDGAGIDGSALEGGARRSEHDVIARPDITGFQVLPWRADANVARMFADIQSPDGTPFPGDCRAALRRVMGRAEALGFDPQIGVELEFYVFEPPSGDGAPVPLEGGSYYDLSAHDIATDFRKQMIEFLEQLGIPVRASYHEAGPSQQEIVLHHADALTTADAVLTSRMAVKQAALNLGWFASLMPKPLDGQPGSGLHTHLSLWDADGVNLFHDETQPERPLSLLGEQFMAGVLAHAGELTLVANQWVNSYTRLASGFEAPTHVNWSRQLSNPLVRVPAHRPGRAGSKRIELRSPDSGCNPYLLFALTLAAGLRGIERGYTLQPESTEPGDGTDLPYCLREATDRFEASELAREALGERIVEWVVANKRREWAADAGQVSDLERRHSLLQR